MRVRLTLIAIALAVLVLAGLRLDDRRPRMPHSTGSSGQLAAQPAPDPALPAIGSAAATASVTVNTLLHAEWHRHLRPAQAVLTASANAPVNPDGATRPRSFPLLI